MRTALLVLFLGTLVTPAEIHAANIHLPADQPTIQAGIPIIDRAPGVEGLVLAVGMYGQGFMMGPGVGM